MRVRTTVAMLPAALLAAGLAWSSLTAQVAQRHGAERSATEAASQPTTIPAGAISASRPSSRPATQPDRRKVFTVKNVQEFVAAIGPDRIIRLQPGEYHIGSVQSTRTKYVRTGGSGLVIRFVHDLRIEGVGEKKVRMVVDNGDDLVLTFEGVHGVELANLEIGHEPQATGCNAPVMSVDASFDFVVRDCTLFGCGTIGFRLDEVSGFGFVHSAVDKCSDGIMAAQGSDRLEFVDSKFSNTHGAFAFSDCQDVVFRRCVIDANTTAGAMFQAFECKKVSLSECKISNNTFKDLMEPQRSVLLEKTEITNWRQPEAASE